MIQVLSPMVKAELTLLEVEQEAVRVHSAEPGQTRLGVAPEAFDAVDVVGAIRLPGELIGSVIHSKVLLVTQVHQPVVATPAVGMNDAVERDFAPNRPLEHGFGAV